MPNTLLSLRSRSCYRHTIPRQVTTFAAGRGLRVLTPCQDSKLLFKTDLSNALVQFHTRLAEEIDAQSDIAAYVLFLEHHKTCCSGTITATD